MTKANLDASISRFSRISEVKKMKVISQNMIVLWLYFNLTEKKYEIFTDVKSTEQPEQA